jgi:hypothetical protein
MGLDMYLNASRYIGDWEHDAADERASYQAIAKAAGLEGFHCDGSPHLTVDLCVAYWRKANAIHAWFVEHCQEGEDECQTSGVEREQLQELIDLCEKVLETKDASLLPPKSGFFFGSTEIDDWYWRDLRYTVKQLKSLLDNPKLKGWKFSYHSSW